MLDMLDKILLSKKGLFNELGIVIEKISDNEISLFYGDVKIISINIEDGNIAIDSIFTLDDRISFGRSIRYSGNSPDLISEDLFSLLEIFKSKLKYLSQLNRSEGNVEFPFALNLDLVKIHIGLNRNGFYCVLDYNTEKGLPRKYMELCNNISTRLECPLELKSALTDRYKEVIKKSNYFKIEEN